MLCQLIGFHGNSNMNSQHYHCEILKFFSTFFHKCLVICEFYGINVCTNFKYYFENVLLQFCIFSNSFHFQKLLNNSMYSVSYKHKPKYMFTHNEFLLKFWWALLKHFRCKLENNKGKSMQALIVFMSIYLKGWCSHELSQLNNASHFYSVLVFLNVFSKHKETVY